MSNRVDHILETIQNATSSKIEFDKKAILTEYHKLEDNQSSIAIKVLSVVGGFLATIAFLGFLFLSVLQNSEIAWLITGLFFIGFSIVLNRKYEKLIIDTFSISAYAIGIFLLVFGLKELDVNENLIAVFTIFIALISLYLTQNYILAFVSILVVNISLVSLLVFIHSSYNLIHLYNAIVLIALVYVFLFEAKIIHISAKLSKLYNPLRISLVISFLFGLGFLRTRNFHGMQLDYIWHYAIVLFIAIIYLISKILKLMHVTNKNHQIGSYVLSAIILALTAFSPSILGAILLILLSFYVNYKFSFALGVIALIYAVSQYYYDLNYTLLTKSILLFTSGILFLALYLFTSKLAKND